MRVSKTDAARRQLEVAIRMYFSDADPVAVHTLTAAAYNIIRDVSKATGLEEMLLKGQMLAMVRPGKEGEFIAAVNKAENFFKHADRDHDKELEFNPRLTELMLVDAVEGYWNLAGEMPQVFRAYQIWYIMNNEELFEPKAGGEFITNIIKSKPTFRGVGKREFLNLTLEAMNQQNVGT